MTDELAPQLAWEKLEQLIAAGDAAALGSFLTTLPSGETARTIARLDSQYQQQLLELLPAEDAADLVEALSHAQAADLIEDLPAQQAAAIVDHMASDEQVDLLAELDDEDAAAILDQMSPQEASDVRRLTRYGPDTAGGLMITEYVSYGDQLKVDDVMSDLRLNSNSYAEFDVQYVYVVTDQGQLRGVVRLRDIVLTKGWASITQVMQKETFTVSVLADLDELDDFFNRHYFYGVPVIDEQGKMVGVVRRAAVEEALGERADKVLLRIGGIITGEELRTMPVASRALRRLTFLGPNILLNLISASVIAFFLPTLREVAALMIFLPILSDMSGCSGSQAFAVSMRELSLGLVKPYELLRVLGKEAAVGVINGLVLGVVLGLAVWAFRGNPYLGLVVGAALGINSIVAVSIGGTIPLVLRRIGVDPALASGPILTTVTDLCGFFLALTFATLMLPLLRGT